MENFFDLLDLESQEVITACVNEVTYDVINKFLGVFAKNRIFGGNETHFNTVTSDTIRDNKKFKCDVRMKI